MTSLAELVQTRRVLTCVGAGGVGKTTVAAALALAAARRGRRAVVITIDPARRLADALGMDRLENEPRPIPLDRLAALDVSGTGELFAMMLDMKRTFDEMVERFAPDAESRDRILANPIYQHVSDALAGSAEYSAMEKVYELCEGEAFDLVVVDTPPSQHALDFLDAPQRLMEFLDSRIVQLLVHPAFAAGRFGFKVFQRGAHRVLQMIERVSGVGFLEDLSDFLMAFDAMSEGFRDRAREVRGLLMGPGSGFVLVAGPGQRSTDDARLFLEHLEGTGVPVEGMVLNRTRTWPGGGAPPERVPADGDRQAAIGLLAAALLETERADFPAEAAAQAALEAVAGYAATVRRDREVSHELVERTLRAGRFALRVPELPSDVHDLDGLARIADALFETPTHA